VRQEGGRGGAAAVVAVYTPLPLQVFSQYIYITVVGTHLGTVSKQFGVARGIVELRDLV